MRTWCVILLIAFILHATNCESNESINNFIFDELICHDIPNLDIKIDKVGIRFVLRTLDRKNEIEDTYIPITTSEKLLSDAKYKTDKPLVIFISGFKTNLRKERSTVQDVLARAYVKFRSSEVNFVTIDTADYVDHEITDYYKSAFNVKQIGSYLAEAMGALIQNHPKIANNLHLIGHSLGAHICGQIGRELKKVKIFVPRITGLDPAGPCFYGILKGLGKDDANFVDIIHTNPGFLGTDRRVGHIDFYPNGGIGWAWILAPTCDVFSLDPFVWVNRHICSHNLSWAYYAESVVPDHENDFLPKMCRLDDRSECNPQNYPMGYAANPSYPNGLYIMKANKGCPYGGNNITPEQKKVCNIFKGIHLSPWYSRSGDNHDYDSPKNV